jgi:ABC-type cobalt transport system, ATPase component
MSIKIEHLTHIYMKGSPFEKKALNDISITIEEGQFVALIGHTGSGKSTLIQHVNGLLKPDSGKIIVDGVDITDKNTNLSFIRKRLDLYSNIQNINYLKRLLKKTLLLALEI